MKHIYDVILFQNFMPSELRKFGVLIRFVAILIIFLTMYGCGDGSEVQVKLGPVITDLVEKHEAKQEQISKEERFLATLDVCSSDQHFSADSSTSLGVETELIGAKTAHPQTAITLTGRFFSLAKFKLELEEKHSLLTGKSQDQNTAVLDNQGDFKDAPFVIRTQCFELKKGEVLETKGHDLYIISDKIIVNGEIRTSPDAIEDFPGRAAGHIRILGIKVNFGLKALLNATGGNAGEITHNPTVFLEGKDLENKRQEIKSALIEAHAAEWSPGRPPRPSEANYVFRAWEQIRHMIAYAEPWEIEDEIYRENDYLRRAVSDNIDDRYKSERQFEKIQNLLDQNKNENFKKRRTNFGEVDSFIIGAWRKAIQQANSEYNKRRNGDERDKTFHLLPSKRLTVDVKTQIIKDQAKKGIRLVAKRDQLKFIPLNGGRPGQIEVRSAFPLNTQPNLSHSQGQKSEMDQTFPAWASPNDEFLIPFKQTSYISVYLAPRKQGGGDDKTIIDPEIPPFKVSEAFEEKKIPIVDSTTVLSTPHPNYKVEKDQLSFYVSESVFGFDLLTNTFEKWALENKSSKMKEATKLFSAPTKMVKE